MKHKYKYDRKKALEPIHRLAEEGRASEDDIIRSSRFINDSFDVFHGVRIPKPLHFLFAIPTRISRSSDDYWDEVHQIIPALAYLSNDDAFRVLSSLPPTVIETYIDKEDNEVGGVMFIPIFEDMRNDFLFSINAYRKINERINDGARIACSAYSAKYFGLGATLPKLSNMGRDIKENILTTTGHAGTVWLLLQTIENVAKETKFDFNRTSVGFIGGGSIGLAAMKAFAKKHPETTINIFDLREKVNRHNLIELNKVGVNCNISASNSDLIEKSDLIVSAVTSKISTDNIDLKNKIIIDDSQPGSFDRSEVELSGGKLVWVVGRMKENSEQILRKDKYKYGNFGLASEYDLWGCEAELISLFRSNAASGITREVRDDDIDKIQKLFSNSEIEVAPYQSFGNYTTIAN